MVYHLSQRWVNSFWANDAIWRHGSGLKFAEVMAWWRRQQAITCANVDISSTVFSGIHMRAISQDVLVVLTIILFKKITTFPCGQWVNIPTRSCVWIILAMVYYIGINNDVVMHDQLGRMLLGDVFSGIHMRAISQDVLVVLTIILFKNYYHISLRSMS